jgi:hypothetical protein
VRSGCDPHASRHPCVDDRTHVVHALGLRGVIFGPADLRRVHLLAVDRDHVGVRHVVAFDAGVAFFDSAHKTREQLVLAVGGEHMPDQAATARPERQPFCALVLTEVSID